MENQWMTPSKCHMTGKTRYHDAGTANTAMMRIKAKKDRFNNITNKRYKRRQGKPDQCRSYYCKHCKGFHLTSSSTPIKQKFIEQKFQDRIKVTNGLIVSENEVTSWKDDSLPFPETQKP